MQRFRTKFITILSAQVVCLFAGFWIHGQIASSFRTAESIEVTENARSNDVAPNAESIPIEKFQQVQNQSERGRVYATIFTLLWVGVLQAALVYVILNQVESECETQDQKHYQESISKTKDLIQTRDAVIFGLAQLAESRDSTTGTHLEKIAMYSTRLASAMRRDDRFREQISPAFIRLIGVSSALHDIGKVAVPDSILLKEGPLSPEERELMQEHVNSGTECIENIERRLGSCNFLQMAREVASGHHEFWNGQGYPHGISGKDIPLAARIVSVADVYDALRSERSYKKRMDHDKTVEIICQQSGKQFDPEIVEIFLRIQYQFYEISESFHKEEMHSRESDQEVNSSNPAIAPN